MKAGRRLRMLLRRALTAVAVVVAVLICAAPGSASVAELTYNPPSRDFGGPIAASESLYVRGEGDEANALSTVEADSRAVVIRDAGATIRPGDGCTSLDAHSVRCSFRVPERAIVDFEGGDGDDTIDLASFSEGASVDGGAGADLLIVPPAGSVATGGPGEDRVVGGPGPDFFGDGGSGERDEYEGGAGVDSIGYFNRVDAITIDLAAGVAGAPGEGDRLGGFEEFFGGDGPDTLLGTEGPDKLDGGEGIDRVDGRGGDDELEGGAATPGTQDVVIGGDGDDFVRGAPAGRATLDGGLGDDIISGGSGADEVYGGPGDDKIGTGNGRDTIDAGPGNDRVSPTGQAERVICGSGRDLVKPFSVIQPAEDCELISVNQGLAVTRLVRIHAGQATLRLYCTRPNKQRRCRGTVRLRQGPEGQRRSIGTGRFRVTRGRSGLARIPLTRGAIRRYRSRGRLSLSPFVTWRRRVPGLGSFPNFGAWIVVARRPDQHQARRVRRSGTRRYERSGPLPLIS